MPDVSTIDLQFLGHPRAIAAYLVRAGDDLALIECGPHSTHEHLLSGLRQAGVTPSDIRHVLLTHIHLDHAGGAWWWAEQGAMIHVHPFGEQHLADPVKLISSATRIYGDQMDRLWGDIRPVPRAQLRTVRDLDTITIGSLELIAHETPGHARHHHAFQLGDTIFAGDIAGITIPGHDLISVPTPPPEFDLEVWIASIRRLVSLRPSRLYPTHFGAVQHPREHLRRAEKTLREHTAYVANHHQRGMEPEAIVREYIDWATDAALHAGLTPAERAAYLSDNVLQMSVHGILRYLDTRPVDRTA